MKRNWSPFKKMDGILGVSRAEQISESKRKVREMAVLGRSSIVRNVLTADFARLGCTKRDLSRKQGSKVWLMSPVRSDKAAVRDLHAKTNTCVQHELRVGKES